MLLTLFLGQVASAFLLLSLVASVFTQTASNFGVTGIVLSLSTPAFFLMAFAGLTADIIDRKKIIIIANIVISVIVLLVLLMLKNVYVSISLSFLYFAGNSFFLPAISAASAQLVKKSQLLIANSLFIFTLSSGQIIGLFIASIIQFIYGNLITLVICEVLLIIAIFLPMFLPALPPLEKKPSFLNTRIKEIAKAFVYIFKSKIIWIFFVMFASIQAIIAFGATLGPGFFNDIINIPITKSPILMMPSIALGLLLGVVFIHKPKMNEAFLIKMGFSFIGFTAALLGLIIKVGLIKGIILLIPASIFLAVASFSVIIIMIASRTVLQKKVAHSFQGSVFGANIILAAFLSSLMSPLAAAVEVLIGYVNVLIYLGIVLLLISFVMGFIGKRWKL